MNKSNSLNRLQTFTHDYKRIYPTIYRMLKCDLSIFVDEIEIINSVKTNVMQSMKNRVQLIGNLGRDIEIKETKTGRKYAKFSLATNENYSNASGDRITNTQWHNLTAWGKTAEIMSKILVKGNEVAVEGRITYNKYEDQEGITRYSTDIVLSEFHKLTKSTLPI